MINREAVYKLISQMVIGISLIGKCLLYSSIATLAYYMYNTCRGRNADLLKSLTIFIVFTYCFSVLVITGIADPTQFNPSLDIAFNFIPFANEEGKLILLNYLMFIPFGILLPIVFRQYRITIKKVLLITLIVVIVIEVLQTLFFSRLADIDDVIANTAGSITGYGFYSIVCALDVTNRIINNRKLSIAIILLVASAILCIEIKHICIGDIFLMQLGISPWIGMSPHILSASGFHITEIIGIFLSSIALSLTKHNVEKPTARESKVIAAIGICLIAYMCINIILGLMRY